MKRIRMVSLFLIIAIALCACGSKQPTNQVLTARDAGAPCSDWGQSKTGSAKYLDGSTVIVSIFLEDTTASWTEQDRTLVMHNMDVTNDFLVAEGKRYGKSVNLIYDIEEHTDLEYHFKYGKAFPGSTDSKDDTDEVKNFVSDMTDYLHTQIPAQDIMKKYNVNSIGYLFFIDNEADAATAYHYYVDYQGYYYEEFAFINLRWESTGNNVNPDAYAHEILHLFGARDLYYTDQTDGITREFVDYVAEEKSKDIMLGFCADAVTYHDSISSEITNITAYFLGWKDYIAELERFPSIKVKYPAVFTFVNDTHGNYESYTLEARLLSEEAYKHEIILKILNVLYVIIILAIVVYDIVRINKKRKADNVL